MILTQMLLVNEYADEEAGDWHDWVAFVSGFFAELYPDPSQDEQECSDWIDRAVAAFAGEVDARGRYAATAPRLIGDAR